MIKKVHLDFKQFSPANKKETVRVYAGESVCVDVLKVAATYQPLILTVIYPHIARYLFNTKLITDNYGHRHYLSHSSPNTSTQCEDASIHVLMSMCLRQ
jgi:hypothetical protein